MRSWDSDPTIRGTIWVSFLLGFVFTLNQGVGVSGWLYEWLREIDLIWLGVAFNLVKNTILAALVIFGVLYAARHAFRRQHPTPDSNE